MVPFGKVEVPPLLDSFAAARTPPPSDEVIHNLVFCPSSDSLMCSR